MKNIKFTNPDAAPITFTAPETEAAYRADPRVNQSLLKKMAEKGPYVLWEDKESEPTLAMQAGSICDMECTWPAGSVSETYATVDEGLMPSDTLVKICQYLVERLDEKMTVTEALVLEACESENYGGTWKPQTKMDKIKACIPYLKQLVFAKGKTIVSKETMDKGMNAAMSLKTHEATKGLFVNDNPNLKYYFQLPVFGVIEDVECKALLDLVIVDLVNKTIYIYDIKTMAGDTIKFQYNVRSFRYDIQAAHYAALVSYAVNKETGENWDVKYNFAVESSTHAGTPVVYTTDNTFLLGGWKGVPEVIVNGQVLRGSYPGVLELIAQYKEYMSHEGDTRHVAVRNNNHILPLKWNYTTY